MKYKDNLRAKSKVNHIEGEKIEAVAEIYWYPDYPKDDIAKLSKTKIWMIYFQSQLNLKI